MGCAPLHFLYILILPIKKKRKEKNPLDFTEVHLASNKPLEMSGFGSVIVSLGSGHPLYLNEGVLETYSQIL
jgi:hypothetical protein